MKKSKLAVARGAMHDARHAENTLRDNYRKAKKAADEFRREAIALCAEKESWIFERSKLIKQRDELLAALQSISKITGEAGFNIGGPIEHCPGELEHDEAKRLLSLACEYLKDTSKAAHRVIASMKGSAA